MKTKYRKGVKATVAAIAALVITAGAVFEPADWLSVIVQPVHTGVSPVINSLTAYAATNAEFEYTDTNIYTHKFAEVDTDDLVLTSDCGNYTLGVYKHSVSYKQTVTDESGKTSEKTVTEQLGAVLGIKSAGSNIGLNVDLTSVTYTPTTAVATLLTEEGVELISDTKVLYVADSVFSGLSIKTVDLTGIQYIGSSVFAKCPYITEVVIPDSVRYMGTGVFSGSGLKTLTIGYETAVIPASTCSDTKLSSITFANDDVINTIGDNAFKNTVLTAYPLGETTVSLKIGKNAFSECTQITSLTLPENVYFVSEGAFKGCTGLKDITMPESLLAIDKQAFYGCSALATINFNTALQGLGGGVFGSCTALKEVVGIPESMYDWVALDETTGYGFGNGVFSGCSSLRSVELPSSLTYVPDQMFSGCQALTDVVFAGNITGVGEGSFSGCSNLQEVAFTGDVSTIAVEAFMNCTSLRTIPVESCDSVGDSAFAGCTALTEAKLIADSYGVGVFKNCTALVSADINGDSSETFPESMFVGCSKLKGITNNGVSKFSTVQIVGETAFSGCTSLTSVDFPNVVILESGCFKNCSALKSICSGDIVAEDYAASCFEGCTSLTQSVNCEASTVGAKAFYGSGIKELKITGTVGTTAVFGNNAFANCKNLKFAHLFVDEGIEYSIGTAMFSGCTSLESAYFNGIEITNSMFEGCTSLKTVEFPNAKTVGDSSFADCSDLRTITANTFIAVGDSAFMNCVNLTDTKCDMSTAFTGVSNFSGCTGLRNMSVGVLTKGMFNGCTSLKSVDLADSVSVIPDSCFLGCASLSDIDISGITEFGASSMSGTGISGKLSLEGLSSIGKSAFAGCTKITGLQVEASSMGESAFSGCTSLYSAEIMCPTIAKNAFLNCDNLQKVDMPTGANNVTSIGATAFKGCYLLKDLIIPSTVTSIGTKGVGYPDAKIDANFWIIGEVGSYAETYATDNGITFVSIDEYDTTGRALSKLRKGDVDCNGIVSVADAVRMQSWLVCRPVGVYGANMDMNGDLRVDVFDLCILKRMLIEGTE